MIADRAKIWALPRASRVMGNGVRRSTMLRAAVGVAIVTAGVASPPAHASLFVGQYRGLQADVTLFGADGAVYDLDVTATESVVGVPKAEQALYLDVRRCAHSQCVSVQHSRTTLPDGAVSVSPAMTAAALNTVFGGVRLQVVARGQYVDPSNEAVNHPGADLGSLEIGAGGPSLRTDTYMLDHGAVTLGPQVCRAHLVQAFTYQAADPVGDDERDPRRSSNALPSGMFKGHHAVSCQ